MERRLLCKVEKIRIFIKKGSTNTRETKESPQKERAQKKILGILQRKKEVGRVREEERGRKRGREREKSEVI